MWLFVAYLILGTTFIISQIENADRQNENKRLARKICIQDNLDKARLTNVVRTLLLTQPNLSPILVYNLNSQLNAMKPIKCAG